MANQSPTTDLHRLPTDEDLGRLQWTTVEYYLKATYPVDVERDVLPRDLASKLVLKKLRFFRDSTQGPDPNATGYNGFYYHFLDINTGCRVWQCELSTIDSTFLFAGMLTCA